MTDAENMRMVISNFRDAIVGTVQHLSDEAIHAEHLGDFEEGVVDEDCAVCLRESPEWVAERESARRSYQRRELPMDPKDDPREAFRQKIEQF